MRIKLERPVTRKDYGKTRTISKFLWFPKKINYEIRWFEKVLIAQEVDYQIEFDKDHPYSVERVYYWKNVKWVDPPINLK